MTQPTFVPTTVTNVGRHYQLLPHLPLLIHTVLPTVPLQPGRHYQLLKLYPQVLSTLGIVVPSTMASRQWYKTLPYFSQAWSLAGLTPINL